MKKKAVSLLLIFALLIPCAICPVYAADQDELVGRWEAEADLASAFISSIDIMLAAMLAEGFDNSSLPTITIGDHINSLPISVYLEFHSDGTVESGLVNAEGEMEALNRQLEVAIRGYYNVLLEQLLPFIFAEEFGVQITAPEDLEEHLGMSLDEFCLANIGMSLNEIIDISFEEAFPAGADYLQALGLYDICSAYEWEGEYSVKNGRIYFDCDSDSFLLYPELPPYYEISRQGLSLYLSETKALKDMTLDDFRALDGSFDVDDILPAELNMSKEDTLRFVAGLLNLVYDLTYTRA